jgi:formylglycine-generating enzyme required for sulfatase activity
MRYVLSFIPGVGTLTKMVEALARRVETLKIKVADQVGAAEIMQISFEPQLVRVPAGAFLMGSSAADKSADDNEKPQYSG